MAKSMNAKASSIGGFKVLPVQFSSKSTAGHVLYYKEHNVRGNSLLLPADKTIFVLNVPPYCNKRNMKNVDDLFSDQILRGQSSKQFAIIMKDTLFGEFGKVRKVYLQDKPTLEPEPATVSKYFSEEAISQGFKIAYVIFNNAASVGRAMNFNPSKPFVLSNEKHPLSAGYEKWCSEYKQERPNLDLLQKEIDVFMQKHDRQKAQETRQAKKEDGVADDEGWIKVTKKTTKKQRPFARTEKIQLQLEEKEKKKRAQKELINFYSFQMRETKREHIAELRRKFEEDKQRIAQLKVARRFKPY